MKSQTKTGIKTRKINGVTSWWWLGEREKKEGKKLKDLQKLLTKCLQLKRCPLEHQELQVHCKLNVPPSQNFQQPTHRHQQNHPGQCQNEVEPQKYPGKH
jgi:hypothetical protein